MDTIQESRENNVLEMWIYRKIRKIVWSETKTKSSETTNIEPGTTQHSDYKRQTKFFGHIQFLKHTKQHIHIEIQGK
jgi:hypothetical protein